MESFIETCYYCNGSGYVDYDLNKTNIPYQQHLIEESCENCSGHGVIRDTQAIIERIQAVNEMIYVFQQKMKIHQRLIPELRRCYLNELADKYEDKVDTYARAIARLIQYKQKLP